MDSPAPKRVVTSAIDGMSVKEVRRCLHAVRTQWMNANTEPFFITNMLEQDPVSIQMFSLLFVSGQHRKRHSNKPAAKRGAKK
jgi:hypothetical protein